MEEKKKNNGTMLIVLINMIILISYTLFIRISSKDAYAIIPLAFIILLHFLICLVLGAAWERFRRAFFLSSLAIVLIGFSTCYIAFNIH
ncbi:MAG: hypothetical protein ACHQIM_17695 [Sphingobacteriales bacterium]